MDGNLSIEEKFCTILLLKSEGNPWIGVHPRLGRTGRFVRAIGDRFDFRVSYKTDDRQFIKTEVSSDKKTMLDFKARVLTVVAKIPKGKTLTYQAVARRAGQPRAYRAVGNILSRNFDPKIPCHRVIRSGGQIGGYNRGAGMKKRLLYGEIGG